MVLGITATILAVLILWALKWIDHVIPREHRARLVIACDPGWSVLQDVAHLLEPMKFRAQFKQRSRSMDSGKAEYAFELAWKSPLRTMPPSDLLAALESRFVIRSFELTSDNGR